MSIPASYFEIFHIQLIVLIYNFDESYTKLAKLEKELNEFYVYIKRNTGLIENNKAVCRHGNETISTAFTESVVNQVINKRF